MFVIISQWVIPIIVAIIGSKQLFEFIKWLINLRRPKDTEPFSISFDNLSYLVDEVSSLFNTTTADRFLLLVANIDDIKKPWVSCLYEQHKSNVDGTKNISVGATSRYSRLVIDEEYYKMIKEVKEKGVYRISNSSQPNGILKRIYDFEGVKYSNLYYLYSFYDEKNDMIFFLSIAKHSNQPFEDYENLEFDFFINNLKNRMKKYG